MIVIKMYCDRCGKEFTKWNDKYDELIGVGELTDDDRDTYLDAKKDLCKSCYTELEKWWDPCRTAESEETK